MSSSIGTTRVEEAMNPSVQVVQETDRMEDVAKIFEREDINAAPVVDQQGSCVGIITSHDLVEYEATRDEMKSELNRGTPFDIAHYCGGVEIRIPGRHFDEAGFHMTKTVMTAEAESPLSQAARTMCRKHIHHVVILDAKAKPVGILSALDILGHIVGEPVSRP
jgi:CBS domain-containing protein